MKVDGTRKLTNGTHWAEAEADCSTGKCCNSSSWSFECLNPNTANVPPCKFRRGRQLGYVIGKNKEIACIIHYVLGLSHQKAGEGSSSFGFVNLKWVTDYPDYPGRPDDETYYVCSSDDYKYTIIKEDGRMRIANDVINQWPGSSSHQ
jgi:hypothetical protein